MNEKIHSAEIYREEGLKKGKGKRNKNEALTFVLWFENHCKFLRVEPRQVIK